MEEIQYNDNVTGMVRVIKTREMIFEKELLTLEVFSLKIIQLRGDTIQAYKRDWVQSRISDQLSSTISNMRPGDLSAIHVVQS